jgi:hypothetical protein
MRQSEPALHETEEPEVIAAEGQSAVVAVAATVSKMTASKVRPVIATVGAKAAR